MPTEGLPNSTPTYGLSERIPMSMLGVKQKSTVFFSYNKITAAERPNHFTVIMYITARVHSYSE